MANSSAFPDLELYPGDRYGEFQILSILGEGFFAKVYAAQHPTHPVWGERVVALKISRKPLFSETAAIRALREIRALQSLHNPHVVHILDHGMGEDERWYMVMELLQGANLLALHDFDIPMPAPQAFRIVYQTCVGIDEAHRQGIVHRDLKPENLWIQRDSGDVKVLDFGLARAWNTGATVGEAATVDHVLIGTPHYAQPEQVHSGELTPASDVYSLGMLLYELITGHVPYFPDESWSSAVLRLLHKPLQWLGAHVKKAPVPIERHPQGRELSEQARALIHAMLEKEPENRPATGGVAARMLAWVLHEDYGHEVAARLSFEDDASRDPELVVPGSHTLGERVGTLALSGIGGSAPWGEPRVVAKLDWVGSPQRMVLTPIEAGIARVGGVTIEGPIELDEGVSVELGALRMRLNYPSE